MFDDLVKEFDQHISSMEGLDKVEVTPCDVQDTLKLKGS